MVDSSLKSMKRARAERGVGGAVPRQKDPDGGDRSNEESRYPLATDGGASCSSVRISRMGGCKAGRLAGDEVAMLLRFRVANHRSIRADHELSLVATEFNEGTARPTGVRAEGREIGVVPVAGIFGANASGKSNVLAALRAMREAVRMSLAEWAQDAGVPREPFALDPTARDDTTLFEVDLLLGERPIRYTYGFELSDERVEAEWLHAFPHGRKQVWFDREADRADGEEFSFPGDGLKGGKERLAEFTRPKFALPHGGRESEPPPVERDPSVVPRQSVDRHTR